MKTLYARDDLLIGAIKRTRVTKQMDETLMDCHERELILLCTNARPVISDQLLFFIQH
ncbi:hypothetical protein [Ginsengibacter hankyongi]|uniref:hypothetical protein n=1 Tax=Ginsengibacter hankyongi TaxID=2607284 RepID=UPI0019281D56|nr:hypothetical protein [Ginsengibacter hankyongi]